jgi:hypothetical protein
MYADFQCAVDERLAQHLQWARYRGRSWATKTFMCELCEELVRVSAHLSAQSSTGGLIHRIVGAITRSNKDSRRCMLR